MSLTDRVSYQRHHDDDYIDEIRIRIVPRYKTSGLSGDEWRIAARVELLRKGHVLLTRSYRDPKTAADALPWLMQTASEEEDFQRLDPKIDEALCFQPGCAEPAVAEYELKKEYCRYCASPQADGGHGRPAVFAHTRVKFCQRHLRRGDCGFQDSDINYIVISGPGPDGAQLKEGDARPALQTEPIVVENLERLPEQVREAVKAVREKNP